MPEAPLHEQLASLFSDLSQHVFGKALPIKKLESMNRLSRKFGTIILQAAERTALKKCKVLNDAVKSGFGLMAKDVVDLQARVDVLEEQAKLFHTKEFWVPAEPKGDPPEPDLNGEAILYEEYRAAGYSEEVARDMADNYEHKEE